MSDDLKEIDSLPEDADASEECVDCDPVEKAERERDEARDKMLRALAELENYRARANRERAETLKYAGIDLMRDLLPVWDNLERTLEAAEKTHNVASLIEGVRLVGEQFLGVLSRHHCTKIEAVGQPFDPHFHASVAQIPSADHEPNAVMHETQVGFKLYDRIVRPSQVVLAQEPVD